MYVCVSVSGTGIATVVRCRELNPGPLEERAATAPTQCSYQCSALCRALLTEVIQWCDFFFLPVVLLVGSLETGLCLKLHSSERDNKVREYIARTEDNLLFC